MNDPCILLYGASDASAPRVEELAAMLAGAGGLVWWAVGAPLTPDAGPILVQDHIRLFAGAPALTGPSFVPMHDPYDLALAEAVREQLTGQTWGRGVVVDVPHAAALSPAEKAAFHALGAHWAVAGATAATLHARQARVPVAGLVSSDETFRDLSARVDLRQACRNALMRWKLSC